MSIVDVRQLSKRYPARAGHGPVLALDGVELSVEEGEIVCIVGPSGCGKTSLLNILAGFEDATSGAALFKGAPIQGPSPDRGVVFQEAALFPWLSARRNVEFGLVEKRMPKAERHSTSLEYLRLVGLEAAADRLPAALSGGMRQRVALARSLANGATVLLLDEPFAALDAQTKAQMHGELLRIWETMRTTMVLITHSIDEAVALADRVVVMAPNPGRIVTQFRIDLDRPRDDTSHPFNEYKREIRQVINDCTRSVAS
ncbi:ABC transporter ATP-binding protein [Nocardioides soli]|uniref:ABC-type nitrate/sulfonate/bicarbonate transport system ATPase subunit n=1 Tax=Nocardioides soli TaxID=1036020 RepID=A0A7W4Z0A9_9ACTN|nr:ABC transporter ATP-binding protein [Nocardioides soli]MBB3041717.1 ABC-type nitrate/sulfonate/bicarbonate transport system ATPase subunit [Nocardioides soli]